MFLWLEQFALLLVVCVFPWTRWAGGLNLSAGECTGAMILGFVSLVFCGWMIGLGISARLCVAEDQTRILALRDRLRRAMAILRWASIVWLTVGLFILGWGNRVEIGWGLWGAALPVAQILWMLGPVLTWIGLAATTYSLVVKFRQTIGAGAGPIQATIHPMPPLGQYLSWFIRNSLNTLVVVFSVMTVQLETILWVQRSGGWTKAWLFLYLLLPVILYAFSSYPRIWIMNSEAIEEKGLRRRLNFLALDAGVHLRQVRIWKTHFMVANAYLLGLTRWSRFILISDALLESLDRDELHAVFAHELGHGRHRHATWLFGTLFAGSILGSGLAAWWVRHFALSVQWFVPVQVIFFVIFVAAVMPAMRRVFEHQADWFAVLAMAQWRGTQRYTDDEFSREAFVSQSELSTGLAAIRSALLRIAQISNHPTDKRSWTHPSTNVRITALERLIQHRQAVKLMDDHAKRLCRVVVGAFIIGLLLMVFQ
jgi:Zn-dependent protease with chaperone function